MKHILVVDDERGPRESLNAIFNREYDVSLTASADEALVRLAKSPVDLALLDVRMPGKDGLTLLKEIRELDPDLPVIMISAGTEVRPAVEAMRVGAFDYVTKPFDVVEIQRLVARALESRTLHRRVETLESEVARQFPVHGIVGSAPSFHAALDDARKAAESDATVLVLGESGTGKELVARMIHTHSARREEPFVAVHCAALPEDLLESELFGYEKGAFTNATQRKPGRFDLAGSGTLFFDEVGEMPMATQVKLLRVLQEREFMRVGGTRVIRTEARIVAATSRDLKQEVKEGRFRDDLYYRLGVVPVPLPPLRDRREDIPELVRHFIASFGQRLPAATQGCDEDAMARLCHYAWPGNVRELHNVIERMLVLHRDEPVIRAAFLPAEFQSDDAQASPGGMPSRETLPAHGLEAAVNDYERCMITLALSRTDGVQTRAARLLGTTRRKLRYRMDRLAIPGAPTGETTTGNAPTELGR